MLNFLKLKRSKTADNQNIDRGIMVFENTSEVIQAENILKAEGWKIKVMGPPPEIRSGCDLVIEFPLIEELNILRSLEEAEALPLEIVPVSSPLLQPVDLFQNKDFGKYLMIRAANMKLTIDKETQDIVNISGGGCPDVPYLAQEMVGKTMADAPDPREIGHTLCGYALQLAYEEMTRRCSP
ncbi:MAG: putative Se/S carrier-like protein [Thermodesulfobacteriota bacterium]|nr:putative Se/S carrier-like protein [Thermodesulfobacteriota bacterium]